MISQLLEANRANLTNDTNHTNSANPTQDAPQFEISADENSADIIVINSCTVTNNADKSLREYISRVKKLNKKIFFTGCALNSVGKVAFEKGAIFGAFGASEKEKIASFITQDSRFFKENNLAHIDSKPISRVFGRTRGFIKVQEGCDFKCSYCIIPSVRGKARSLKRENILNQVQILADSGVSEVVLSGTNLGSYGKDSRDSLPKLISEIAKIRGINRVRLGSLEPSQIKSDFLEMLDLAQNVLEKHLHIAIQHTDDSMLKLMNRANRFEKDLALFESIAKKGFALGTDFIIAHPNENEAIFETALKKLEMMPLTHIHCFIFSPRKGTKSALMPNITPKIVAKERLRRVKALIEAKNLAFRNTNCESKTPLEILVESQKGAEFYGFDQFFNKIAIKSQQNLSKKWVTIRDFLAKKDINYAEI